MVARRRGVLRVSDQRKLRDYSMPWTNYDRYGDRLTCGELVQGVAPYHAHRKMVRADGSALAAIRKKAGLLHPCQPRSSVFREKPPRVRDHQRKTFTLPARLLHLDEDRWRLAQLHYCFAPRSAFS